ncbi:cyclin-dependent protein kinase inhibitor SMR10-like [Heracleum sosnowskyi]|uniref:Cyclin-dependent protein kinase inhibitor SMR10-like n=1 Tax=Heracleum sosnowskyi TaxID=360622 RepID=A0AAD8IZE4_9APIA|nr:cyclin-dependent protein kinase inhibitor SMR10-like [Heracleum sosnowskyi]
MGISNTSESLLPEECSFLSRPLFDFQQGSQHQIRDHQEIVTQQQEFDKFQVNLVSSLEIKLSPLLVDVKVEEDNDGCKTPTSLDQKISVLICPPAPRKAKSVPSKKRKAFSSQRRILLDCSSEVESMFPKAILADFGKKMKKKYSLLEEHLLGVELWLWIFCGCLR